ncbi:hypothetical protein GGI15_001404 [Coemansia interrupta]|uniref:Uncharacterized protein n=1 Tax=Coemansia interrupta TaxID=1126814 RepID=A0A9W8HMU4_9FUNG|nr:hypothetical protein GGI15_001404 [Coemansia interrupta]
MQAGASVDMTDKLLVGGNLYARYQATETSSPTATPTETSSNSDASDDSKTTKVVVACVVGVVAIGAAVGFFVYWRLRKRKVRREWDPHGESMNMYAVTHGLNNDVAHVLPPSYAQLEARNRIGQAAAFGQQSISVANTDANIMGGEPKYIRGILVIDGAQTSCELVPLGQSAAFVAASCINQGQNHTYTAYMYDKRKPASSSAFNFNSGMVAIHSQYNETTMANNIAIVKLSNPSEITVESQVAMYDPALKLVQYSQITLNNTMSQWEQVYVTGFATPVSEGCADYSAVYAQNSILFVCTTARGNFNKVGHGVPYGVAAVEGAGKEKYVYALYSHSVMDGAAIESAQNVYSYYTVLSNYAAFAQAILGLDIRYLSNGAFVPAQVQQDPQVNVDLSNGAPGTKSGVLVSGNLYSREGEQTPAVDVDAATTVDMATATQPAESSGSADAEGNESSEGNGEEKKKKGLSTGAIVGIAVGVSVAGIVAAVIGFRYARDRIRRRSAERYWERSVRNLRSAKDILESSETTA